MERKKPARKRGPETKKGIWTAVKDNAALVTVIGALLGVLITGAINTYITNKDHAAQLELEQEKAQDAALQTYLDQMGQMLLNEDLRSSEENSDLRTLTRARTLTTLRALEDAGRKTQVLRFLAEANLVQGAYESSPVISLAHADLHGTDLSDANLSFADLSGAILRDATGVTEEQLEVQTDLLKGSIMPDGSKHP